MELRNSRFGRFYGCRDFYLNDCKGKVSAWPNGKPKHIKVTYKEKQARKLAQEYFDKLIASGKYTGQEAFTWMCYAVKCERYEGFISTFSVERCNKLISRIKKELGENIKDSD